jgi:hypothetical protein
MNASPEQIEFVRRRGIVQCPPSAIFQMYWGPKKRRHNFAETTEADVIRQLAAGDFHMPTALSKRDWKDHKRGHGPGLY